MDWERVNQTYTFAVVLPVPLWALQRYIRLEKTPPKIINMLYCDREAVTFQKLRLNLEFNSRSTFTSIHAKTSVLQATWKGLVEGLQTGPQGDIRQQGGAFVLGPRCDTEAEAAEDTPARSSRQYTCFWAHIDRHNADQVQIPALLMAAGLSHTLYR